MDDPPLDRPLALLLAMTRQSPLPYVRGPAHAPVLRPEGSSAQGPHPALPLPRGPPSRQQRATAPRQILRRPLRVRREARLQRRTPHKRRHLWRHAPKVEHCATEIDA